MAWRGPEYPGEFPTLGYLVAEWIEEMCVIPDGEFVGQTYILTDPMLEFLLWYYRLHPDAAPDPTKPSRAFIHERGGQLVEPQKWGKGPFSASMICAEADGPVLFDGWDANGEPVGRPWSTPWIQVTAVSEGQTANVWRALVPMIELGPLAGEIPDTGATRINLPGGRPIEPVTASARSRLGQPITFAVQDQTEDWTARNGGRTLADNQRRNLAGMGGRWLETANAWDPAMESVAQQTSESEAPGVYKQKSNAGAGSINNKRERRRMLRRVYQHSWWIDVDRIESEAVALLERDPGQAERYFLNRDTPGAGRAYDGERWHELGQPMIEIPDGSLIVVGGAGVRFDDAFALVATDVERGHQWPLGIWEVPDSAGDDYEHDASAIDGVLSEAFERFNVWRAYINPHRIEHLLEPWQGRWGEKRVIGWWTNRPRQMAYAVRRHVTAVAAGDLSHDGSPVLERHIRNAMRQEVNVYDDEHRQMSVLAKARPGSPLKIDGAVAGVLSWEARGDAIAAGALQRQRAGRRRLRVRSVGR